jgi:single-stranded-DNA-specific exonuclease
VGEPRFEIPECEQGAVARLRVELGVSDALAQVLVRRGFDEPARARAFLAADEEHAYTEFEGIEEAIATVSRHVAAGTRITVHGDYDVDGVCSTAVLVRSLRRQGANVDWYLPDRAGDGYGLSMATVDRLSDRGTKLIITADCAITAVEEVARARELGIEVVVSDHHTPRADGVLPAAPIVHPRVCGYPCPDLCATAVAYKLAQGLERADRRACGDGAAAGGEVPPADGGTRGALATTAVQNEDLDLVALATIADVVPLVGENRTLVRRGLRALAGTPKPGLRALMAVAKIDPARVNERTVAFGLAPRLNAAGRLYRADAALELILTEDRARAAQVAQELDSINHERRATERTIRFDAEAQIAGLADGQDRRALVLAGEDWNAGVIGIVASRLAEQHGKPVVLIALEGERGKGSGRSGGEAYDLLAGLTACAEHLSRYGGHRAAAGVELERARVGEFARALSEHAASVLDPEDGVPVERVDAIVDGAELGMALARELGDLAPFGQGNPPISLLLADARFEDVKAMGEGKHARFTVRTKGGRARAVAFGLGTRLGVEEGEPAEATFALEVNEWNGVSEPRLVLRRARPAGAPTIADLRRGTRARERSPGAGFVTAAGGERESGDRMGEEVTRDVAVARGTRAREQPGTEQEPGELVLFR